MLLREEHCLGGQWSAIQFGAGAADVISGPGTGKTTTVCNRIAHLVVDHGIDPTKILALTFNKDAQLELSERSIALLLEAGAQLEQVDDTKGGVKYTGVDARTYHSLGYLICRTYLKMNTQSEDGPVLADPTWLIKQIIGGEGSLAPLAKGGKWRNGMRWNEERARANLPPIDPKDLLRMLDGLQENMILPSKVRQHMIEIMGLDDHDLDHYYTFYSLFHAEKRRMGKLTFADMLFGAWLILTNQPQELNRLYDISPKAPDIADALRTWQYKWDYYIVDEAQDTNPLQGEVAVALLSRRAGNIMVVGDSDQSIYRFRGARPDYITSLMDRLYPERTRIHLSHTRRFVQTVVDVANDLIANNPRLDDYEPLQTAREGAGRIACYEFLGGESEQSAFVADEIVTTIENEPSKTYDDFGIIARTNATIAMTEPTLFARGIRYRVLGGGSVYNRKEIKVTMGFVTAMLGLARTEDICQAMNVARHDNPKGTHFLGDAAVDVVKGRCTENPMAQVEQLASSRDYTVKPYITRGLSSWLELVNEMRCDAEDQGAELGVVTYIRAARALAVDQFVRKAYGEKEDDGDSRFEVLIGLENLAMQYGTAEEFIDVVRRLQADADKPKDERAPAVRIGTGHRWKGLEADTIFVVSIADGIFPHKRSEGFMEKMDAGYQSPGINEERRLMFVAATRAKNHLYFCKLIGPSLFLAEMGVLPVAADPELADILAQSNEDMQRAVEVVTVPDTAITDDPTLTPPTIVVPQDEPLQVRGITDLFAATPVLALPPAIVPHTPRKRRKHKTS